jgi:hypothetical protein
MNLDLVGQDGNVHRRHRGVLGKLLDMIRVGSSLEDQAFRPKNNTKVEDAGPQPARQQTFEPLLGRRKDGRIRSMFMVSLALRR